MADGSIYLGSGGGWKIRSDGTWDVCGECCACTSVRQLTRCHDGTAQSLYVCDADYSWSNTAFDPSRLLYGGVCYRAASSVGTIPLGETALDFADYSIDSRCCECADCENRLPVSADITFAGVTLLSSCQTTITGGNTMSATLPTLGAHNLAFGASLPLGLNCNESLSLGSASVDICGTAPPACTVACTTRTPTMSIQCNKINFSTWRIRVIGTDGGVTFTMFNATFTVSPDGDCESGFVVSNTAVSGPEYLGFAGIATVGWGGTATVTMNF